MRRRDKAGIKHDHLIFTVPVDGDVYAQPLYIGARREVDVYGLLPASH